MNFSNKIPELLTLCKLEYFPQYYWIENKNKKEYNFQTSNKRWISNLRIVSQRWLWYIQCAKLQILTPVPIILPFRGHSFMTSAKGKILTALPPTSTVIQFYSAPPSAVLQWMSIIEFRRNPSPEKWIFWNIPHTLQQRYQYTYTKFFFFTKERNVYKFHKCNKTDRKANTP